MTTSDKSVDVEATSCRASGRDASARQDQQQRQQDEDLVPPGAGPEPLAEGRLDRPLQVKGLRAGRRRSQWRRAGWWLVGHGGHVISRVPVSSPRDMKALVKARPEPGLWLQEVPKPEPGPGEVLIKVLRTGICGTDLHIESWNEWARSAIHPPLVVGHEFVGRVEGWGEGVEHLHQGELVGAEGHIVCGRCRNCMAGRRH